MNHTAAPGTVVDRLLDAIRSGTIATADQLYTPTTVLDAVVPGWRFSVRGDDAVRAEYARWFAHPGQFEELRRHPTGDGEPSSIEVVEYTLTWAEHGVPHAARHVHVLDVDRALDRIVGDHVWCGGRWPAALLAEMAGGLLTEGVAG